jgi:hypothetical protein
MKSPQSGGIHIVLHPHRHAEVGREGLSELESLDAEVDRVRDESVDRVDGAGNPHSDRANLTELVTGDRGHRGYRRGDDLVGPVASGDAQRLDNGTRPVDQNGLGLGSADVYANAQLVGRHDLLLVIERGWVARRNVNPWSALRAPPRL